MNDATIDFVAGGLKRKNARGILKTCKFIYDITWIEEKYGFSLLGQSYFFVKGTSAAIAYLNERLSDLI